MSTQAALQFIRQIRHDENMKQKIKALASSDELEGLVRVGAEAGFLFSKADLQLAHKHDWVMRWLRLNKTKK